MSLKRFPKGCNIDTISYVERKRVLTEIEKPKRYKESHTFWGYRKEFTFFHSAHLNLVDIMREKNEEMVYDFNLIFISKRLFKNAGSTPNFLIPFYS